MPAEEHRLRPRPVVSHRELNQGVLRPRGAAAPGRPSELPGLVQPIGEAADVEHGATPRRVVTHPEPAERHRRAIGSNPRPTRSLPGPRVAVADPIQHQAPMGRVVGQRVPAPRSQMVRLPGQAGLPLRNRRGRQHRRCPGACASKALMRGPQDAPPRQAQSWVQPPSRPVYSSVARGGTTIRSTWGVSSAVLPSYPAPCP
jgi:hypothetical protein